MFNGQRLRQARELRRLTQEDLADLVGKTQGAIANIEGGYNEPSPELLALLAQHTRFPASFFTVEPAIEFPLESLMFRARAATTRREAAAACRYAEIVYELTQTLEAHVNPVPLKLQKCMHSPFIAAQQMRRVMNIAPDTPIQHVINAVEKMGVTVLGLPLNLRKVDAFSAWVGSEKKRPVLAICSGRPGDRLRFNVAHELGHLVMHSDHKRLWAEQHKEADQFAAEFLMPEVAMRREIKTPVTLSGIAKLKPRWGVSIQALIRRAYDLNIITERQYRYLFEHIGAKGWKTREPSNLDIPVERPRALKQMTEIAFGIPIDYARPASEMRLTVAAVKEILDCYEEGTAQEAKQPGKVIQLKG